VYAAAAMANVLIGRHQDEGGEQQIPHPEIRDQPLEERKDEARAVEAVVLQQQEDGADREADDDLVAHLVARGQAVMRSARDLQIVVGESNRAEPRRRQHGDPHIDIRQIRPQQRGDERRGENEQAAHGRRARLGPVRLRTFGANHLADLEFAQRAHEPWAERQADGERRQTRRGGAKRDVPSHVQHGELLVKLEEEPVQHQARSVVSRSTTRSVWTPRDPLTSTTSPRRTSPASASAASSLVAKCRARWRGIPL
jgi:hypothetical protein